MYISYTNGIEVEAVPTYLAEHSEPTKSQYVFAYYIKITNKRSETVRLESRHWVITDGTQETREVKGSGVVGQTPVLEPEQSHEYTSFCPLPTPTGNMRGTYGFSVLDESGAVTDVFQAKIPLFFFRTDLIHEAQPQTH